MVMTTPSPQQVGREFVRQYYTVLHEAPEVLHRFYSSGSTFVHGGVDRPGLTAEEPVVGQLDIDKKIRLLNFKDCHTKIRQVDSQATIGSGVVVQVTGELSNNGEPMRRFMQTFVLAPQTPKKYYVHNDIFRYQDEVYHDISDTESEDHHQQPIEQQSAAVNMGKNYFEQQQQQHHHHTPEVVVVTSPPAPVHHETNGPLLNGHANSNSMNLINQQLAEQEVIAQPQRQQQQQHIDFKEEKPANVELFIEQQNNHVEKSPITPGKQQHAPVTASAPPKEEVKEIIIDRSSWANVIRSSADPSATAQSAAATNTSSNNHQSQSSNSQGQKFKENNNNKFSSSNPKYSSSGSQQQQTGSSNGPVSNNNKSSNHNGGPKPQRSHNNGNASQQQPAQQQQQTQQQSSQPHQQGQQQQQQPQVSQQQQQQQPRVLSDNNNNNSLEDDKKFGRFPDGQQIFVGNLHQDISEQELREHFGKFGGVVEVRINTNMKQMSGRRLPNYGFVVFEERQAVDKLLASSKANNITYKNAAGVEYRLNVEEKRARGFGGGNGPKANRTHRSSSNGSRGGSGNTGGPAPVKKNLNNNHYSNNNNNNNEYSGENRKQDRHDTNTANIGGEGSSVFTKSNTSRRS